jgi:hypothetical protein
MRKPTSFLDYLGGVFTDTFTTIAQVKPVTWAILVLWVLMVGSLGVWYLTMLIITTEHNGKDRRLAIWGLTFSLGLIGFLCFHGIMYLQLTN